MSGRGRMQVSTGGRAPVSQVAHSGADTRKLAYARRWMASLCSGPCSRRIGATRLQPHEGVDPRGRREKQVPLLSGFSSAMVAVPASTSSLLWLTSDGPSGRGRRCVWAVAQVRVRCRRAPADCCFCVGLALLKGPFGRPGPNHGGFESLPAAWFVRGKRRSRQPSDFPRTFTPGLASTESSRRAPCEA